MLNGAFGPSADDFLCFLWQHTPPSVIYDLFADIKKGHVLLDLLEVLSGQQLVRVPNGIPTLHWFLSFKMYFLFLSNTRA